MDSDSDPPIIDWAVTVAIAASFYLRTNWSSFSFTSIYDWFIFILYVIVIRFLIIIAYRYHMAHQYRLRREVSSSVERLGRRALFLYNRLTGNLGMFRRGRRKRKTNVKFELLVRIMRMMMMMMILMMMITLMDNRHLIPRQMRIRDSGDEEPIGKYGVSFIVSY